jgi:hypothetical protein
MWSYRLKPDISKENAFIFKADVKIELLKGTPVKV